MKRAPSYEEIDWVKFHELWLKKNLHEIVQVTIRIILRGNKDIYKILWFVWGKEEWETLEGI